MGLGLVWALASAQFGWSAFTENWIAPFGTVFINLLKLIAVPLVLFSIIDGVASLGDPKTLGRVGMKTLGLYMATTVLAVGIGLLVVNAVQPGATVGDDQRVINRLQYEQWTDNVHQGQTADGLRYSNDPQYSQQWARVRNESAVLCR